MNRRKVNRKVPIKNAMSGFEKHGIKHMSASSGNKARIALDAWIAQYLFKCKFAAGWAALQGSSVEKGVDQGVYYPETSLEKCVEMAMDHLRNNSKMMKNQYDELQKRKSIVAQMVEVALEQLRPFGIPEQPPRGERNQHKVEIPVVFDHFQINCIGYLDYWFPQHNMVVDLKTTAKAPTDWSLDHGIQAAIYKKATHRKWKTNPDVRFLYCLTRKKNPYLWLDMEEPDFYIAMYKRTLRNLEKLLSAHTKEELLSMIPHNPDTFYWNDADAIRAELYPDPA